MVSSLDEQFLLKRQFPVTRNTTNESILVTRRRKQVFMQLSGPTSSMPISAMIFPRLSTLGSMLSSPLRPSIARIMYIYYTYNTRIIYTRIIRTL